MSALSSAILHQTPVLEKVFAHTDTPMLFVCKRVCKKWKETISIFTSATGKFELVGYAASLGSVQLLDWGLENGFEWMFCSEVVTKAAENGRFEVLEWAKHVGLTWDIKTGYCAAEKGRLDVLKWLKENGCIFGWGICFYAVKGNHLEVLKWLLLCGEKCYERQHDDSSIGEEAVGKELGLMQLLVENGIKLDDYMIKRAIELGRVDVLELARREGYDLSKSDLSKSDWYQDAFWCDKHEVVKWLWENGYKFESKIGYGFGNLEILQWALDKGYEIVQETLHSVAAKGSVEVFLWLLDHGCTLDEHTSFYILRSNSLELFELVYNSSWKYMFVQPQYSNLISPDIPLFKWLIEHQYNVDVARFGLENSKNLKWVLTETDLWKNEWNGNAVNQMIIGHFAVDEIKWFIKKTGFLCADFHYEHAGSFANTSAEILEWAALDNGWWSENIAEQAVILGMVGLVKWATHHILNPFLPEIAKMAIFYGQLDILYFLQSKFPEYLANIGNYRHYANNVIQWLEKDDIWN